MGVRLAPWLPALGTMLAIWVVSGQPSPPGIERLWDKPLHAAAYAVLGVLCLRGAHGGLVAPRRRAVVAACLIAGAYGAVDEWHQTWVPGRVPSAGDWIADLTGVAAAVPAFAWAAARRTGPGRDEGRREGR